MGCSGSSVYVKEGKPDNQDNQVSNIMKENRKAQKNKNKNKKKSKVHSSNSFKKEKSIYRYNDEIYKIYDIQREKGQKLENNDNISEQIILETLNNLEKKNNNEYKENANGNNKKSKNNGGKDKNNITKRMNYQKKIEKLVTKEKELRERENEISIKEKKLKKAKENNLIDEKEFKEKKKMFEKEKKQKDSKLNEREKNINKKEEELKKLEEQYFPKIKPILIGLNNIGATCYMNASLQCLSNTKELTEYFLKNYKEKDKNIQIMSHEYHRVLRHLWDENSKEKAYSPNSFKDVLSKENSLFAGIAANDSKDFINFLIERLHQELNEVNKDNNRSDTWMQINQANETEVLKVFLQDFTTTFNSPISKLFYGISETKSQCQGCSIIKYNFQVYSFLEFPLQQVNQFYFNNGKRPLFTNDGKNPDVDLYECFEYNRKIDLMTGDNQMYCNICNKQCNSTYVTSLYSGPNYLILHLNRGRGAVYECKVIFPERLYLFNYITFRQGVTAYELYAVICHLGPSSMSGHFVAYCKNIIDNQWYLYNDGIVMICTRSQQYTDGMPYILFYRILKSNN